MSHNPLHPRPGTANAIDERLEPAGTVSELSHTANGRTTASYVPGVQGTGSIRRTIAAPVHIAQSKQTSVTRGFGRGCGRPVWSRSQVFG